MQSSFRATLLEKHWYIGLSIRAGFSLHVRLPLLLNSIPDETLCCLVTQEYGTFGQEDFSQQLLAFGSFLCYTRGMAVDEVQQGIERLEQQPGDQSL
jgi:hypothetical protein